MLRRFDPGYAVDDALAKLNWTKLNSDKVVMYQMPSKKVRRPFILAWQTKWMLGKLASMGHGSTVSIDATFGTNKYGYQLYTVVCFDVFQNDVPCMWFLMERQEADDLTSVLKKMKEKVNTYCMQMLQIAEEWRPSCFLTDDAKEENVPLNEVFPEVPINLCLWHVRRAWIKKLHSVVKDPFAKALMNGELGNIMYARSEASYTDVELQHMLGIKWGTDADGLQNVQPSNILGNIEVAILGLAASVMYDDESEESADCVILSATPGGDFQTPTVVETVSTPSNPRKVHSLADFQRAIGRMYEEVRESTELCEHAYTFVTQAIDQALTAKVKIELQKESTVQSTCPEPFTATLGNDRSLKQKNDFLELFHSRKRRRHDQKGEKAQRVNHLDEDNRFKEVPTQKMTMHEDLNTAAMKTMAKEEEPSELSARFKTSISLSNFKRQRTQYKGYGSTNSGSNSIGTFTRGKAVAFPDLIILI
ncbi:hypothetical protein R1sor_007442 [Riccia sorocarpa]|uniref:MULE transposase domain-containing protein n=1 Tax=Riccia sorocarpa TaxID=122646 RepID=A0ABD3HUM4_9MARC